MATVALNWYQTNLKELKYHEDSYFYAFSRGNSLLYIGKSEMTTIHQEIKQNLKRLKIAPNGLSLWIGYISDRHFEKASTSEMIDDIENLLIFRCNTYYNDKKTKTYKGILPLTVKNNGFRLIPTILKIKDIDELTK